MRSHITADFRRAFAKLPAAVQAKARKAYGLFCNDPQHPSLRFKKIHATKVVHSVRITRDVRALGVRKDDLIIWFWIGTHKDYDDLVKQL